MPNLENLHHFTSEQSHEQAVINGRKGGRKHAENMKKRKLFKEFIENGLNEVTEFDGVTVSKKEAASLRLVNMLLDGKITDKDFLKALELTRDTIGEKPVEKVELNTIDEETRKEVDELINKCQKEKK